MAFGECDIEPAHQSLLNATTNHPQRGEEGRHSQSGFGISAVETPAERSPQIVDLRFGQRDVPPVACSGWVVECTRDGQVMVTVPGAHVLTFTGLTQLLQRILTHGLQQSITRCIT